MSHTGKSFVFRATGLPASEPDEQLKAMLTTAINENLPADEQFRFDVTIVPSCYNPGQERVALVDFRGGAPDFLVDLLVPWQAEIGESDVNFDHHFYGFTQLYTTKIDACVPIARFGAIDGGVAYSKMSQNRHDLEHHHATREPRIAEIVTQ